MTVQSSSKTDVIIKAKKDVGLSKHAKTAGFLIEGLKDPVLLVER